MLRSDEEVLTDSFAEGSKLGFDQSHSSSPSDEIVGVGVINLLF